MLERHGVVQVPVRAQLQLCRTIGEMREVLGSVENPSMDDVVEAMQVGYNLLR